MSRSPPSRPVIASKTTFDALAVDSGEESEEEEVLVEPSERFQFTPCAQMSRLLTCT